MGVRFGKALLHGCRRGFAQQAEDHDAQTAKDKARDDFIQAQPTELFPDNHRQRANHHPGQRPVTRHPRPHHREQYDRTKRGTEACPGVAHQTQHAVVRVCRQRDGDQRHHRTIVRPTHTSSF